jgi:hypothetical protein
MVMVKKHQAIGDGDTLSLPKKKRSSSVKTVRVSKYDIDEGMEL